MILRKTVFVLGAGASKSFGFPLGNELFQLVLNNSKHGGENRAQLLNTTEFMHRDIDEFLNTLQYSGMTSVDAFLERRPEFLEIGKACIAAQLVRREHAENLWAPNENWMLYLYGRMAAPSLEEFTHNDVAFVTFNYDRSLEHFLSVSLSHTYGKPIEECGKALDAIPIIHLHGRLGYLPWQRAKDARLYLSHMDTETMKVCRNEIKVVHEEITDRDEDFRAAKRLLGAAERVYLMGFGFGTKNVERIGLADLQPSDRFYGTAYGATSLESDEMITGCGGRITLNTQFQCLNFLRTVAPIN